MNDLKQVRDALENKFEEVEIDDVTHMAIPMEEYHELIETLDRLTAPADVPDGYKLIPIEPTREMYEHGVMAKDVMFVTGAGLNTSYFPVGAIYQAMLSVAPTPAPTKKVERIDGLFDAVSIEDLPPPNTDKECDNITKRYEDHIDIYGRAVNETLLEAARVYLKLQSGETEKVNVESLKMKLQHSTYEPATYEEREYVRGYNDAIDHLANTGRLR